MLNDGYYNMDCMEGMKQFPDKYFDLAIVDPPYGGGASSDAEETFKGAVKGRFGGRFEKYLEEQPNNPEIKCYRTGGGYFTKYGTDIKHWDIAPDETYFKELFRVSKNQIIWGGNYFSLPPTRCFLVWRKLTISETFTMAMCEYAWTSFNDNAKWIELVPQGKDRFHPTQKPVALYEWILNHYAKEGDRILDTHVGSASSLVACRNTGHPYVGFEIDEEYYKKSKERLERETAQRNLYDYL
jgi:site-specific DNA-methyltransferase (adenine-specific)